MVEEFVVILIKRAEQAAKEYRELLHEMSRLEMLNTRNLEYIGQLNDFLLSEGLEPVSLEEAATEVESDIEL